MSTTPETTPASPKWRDFAKVAGAGLLAIVAFLSVVLGVAYFGNEPICRFALTIGYETTDGMSAGARLIRDIALFFAGALGILLAVWRNYYLDKQTEATNEQAKAATKQAEVAANQFASAEKRMVDDQFANAAESIRKNDKDGKPLVDARSDGINDMAKLVIKYPEEFTERVVIRLITYIKNNAQRTATPELKEGETPAKPRKLGDDVKAAFLVLGDILGDDTIRKHISERGEKELGFSRRDFSYLDISSSEVSLQHYKEWTKANFRGADLSGASFNENTTMHNADFTKADMNGVIFEGKANLAHAIMVETNLSDSFMMQINLMGADLRGADLSGSELQGANFRGAKMHGTNLQSANLDTRKDTDMTDLSYAHLHGANLADAELYWVNMEGVLLWGVNFYNAALSDILPDAEFCGTYIGSAVGESTLTEDVKSAMNGKVIHAGDEELAGKIEECPDDFNWRLEEYPDSYALNGVLNNFVKEGKNMPGGLALRKQARKLRNNGKISQKWREWLEDVNPDTGEHPEDDTTP